MLTLGAVGSTWMSNARLLQSELCVPSFPQTWFAARVSEYMRFAVGSHRTMGPVFGSPNRPLARAPHTRPQTRPYHNGASWIVECDVLHDLPRQEATLPPSADPRLAHALISRLMTELSANPDSPFRDAGRLEVGSSLFPPSPTAKSIGDARRGEGRP